MTKCKRLGKASGHSVYISAKLLGGVRGPPPRRRGKGGLGESLAAKRAVKAEGRNLAACGAG